MGPIRRIDFIWFSEDFDGYERKYGIQDGIVLLKKGNADL